MKILHTGDIHLDSPFAGLSPDAARQRRSDLRAAFSDMIAFARQQAVDLVLIAGDLFDKIYVTRDTIALLCREFASLHCPVVIAPGNHDPADDKSIWNKKIFPENVYVFTTAELSCFSFDTLHCCVYGYAFESASLHICPLEGQAVKDPTKINILCAHGDATSPISTYGPLPSGALDSFGADYCALGHFHNPENATAALTVPGAYCGCLEGRDFGETGVKGAVLITLEKEGEGTALDWKRIRFCRKVYEQRTLQLDGMAEQADVESALRALLQETGFGADVLLRVTLTGSIDPSLSIDTDALTAIEKNLAALKIRDATMPTWNAQFLQNDQGIRGEVYRLLLSKLEDADPAVRETGRSALRYAMAALSGEELPTL